MARIYLISSAEAEGDLYRIAQGHFNCDLSERGRRQLEALEKRFADIRIDAVYTSDLYRACATAGAICKSRGLTAHARADLRELSLGAWEGQPWGNIAYEESEQVGYFKTALDKWRAAGAETPGQAAARMAKALTQIAAENGGKTVAVISHGLAIRLLLAKLRGVPLGKVHELPFGHTAVSVIEAVGGELRPVSGPDCEPLPDADDQTHEKLYAEPDIDTDMHILPLPWVGYGELMAQAVECVWAESGEDRPFDKRLLLEDALRLTTIVGFVAYDPAGFLQLGEEPGRITLLCTYPGCRMAGLGTQLIGQAVMYARASGAESLSIALPRRNPYRQFFRNQGFTPAEETGDGREIFKKDIGFDAQLPGA